METTVAKNRINSLTATRGIAALMIVIYHFGRAVYPFNKAEHFFNASNIAVSYFFVLSGFVMSWTYLDKGIGYGEFIKRRAIRILPLYYLAIVLSMVMPVYYYLSANIPFEREIGTKLFLDITLTQAYFANYVLPVNPAGWSLSVEMFFYLLFPLLLRVQERKRQLFSWLVVAFFVASQMLHLYQLRPGVIRTEADHNFIHYFPLFHLNEFMVGMLGATLLPKMIKAGIKIPAIVILLLIILAINYRIQGFSLHNGLLAPLFLLLILGMSARDKGFMKNRVMMFLGEISYGIYILQFPVNVIFQFYNSRYFHMSPTTTFYVFLGVLLLATTIAHYTVERAIRKLLLGRK